MQAQRAEKLDKAGKRVDSLEQLSEAGLPAGRDKGKMCDHLCFEVPLSHTMGQEKERERGEEREDIENRREREEREREESKRERGAR